jgi:hypothetical protein
MKKVYVNGKYISIEIAPSEIAEMQAAQAAYESSPEYKAQQIADLKAQLAATDYKAIKYAEGWITKEEYAPIRAERQAIRDKINELEESM